MLSCFSDGPLVLISVTYLREISWLAILGAGLLFLLTWLKRDGLKSAFAWLTRHKRLLWEQLSFS